MATFNGERFLATQLKSIAAQTVPPHELVICDDGSSDATVAVAQQFARDAPFSVRIERNPRRLGFADNFLKAARLCEGDLIAFSDQDDLWHRTKLARCISAFDVPGCRLVVHNVKVVDHDLQPVSHVLFPRHIRRTWASQPNAFDPWFMPIGLAMAFSKAVLDLDERVSRPRAIGWPDQRPMAHDEWIYLLATATGAVVFLADSLALYRQHGCNLAGATQDAASFGRAVRRHAARAKVNPVSLLVRQGDLAREYAATLDQIAGGLAGRPESACLAASTAFYRRIAERQFRRARIYEAGPVGGLRAWGGLVQDRAYGAREKGGFGIRSLVKDSVFALAPSARGHAG